MSCPCQKYVMENLSFIDDLSVVVLSIESPLTSKETYHVTKSI